MTRRWLPLTYTPKIKPVLEEKCTQTIRPGRRYHVKDYVAFHGWEGKPYRSGWSFRTPMCGLCDVIDIEAHPAGIIWGGYKIPWNKCNGLAALDNIDPPTGDELGRDRKSVV